MSSDPRVAFTYNLRTGRYRRRDGRFVRAEEIKAALNGAILGTRIAADRIAAELSEGAMSVTTFRNEMRTLIKNAHLYQAALAKGGWAQLTAEDLGALGPVMRYHYGRLEMFATELAEGTAVFNGSYWNRINWYMNSARTTYYSYRAKEALRLGLTMERNFMGVAEHCGGCKAATDMGAVLIGTLPPIGTRECGAGCDCHIVYS